MKRTLTLAAATAALLLTAIYAFGDLPRPKSTPKARISLHTDLTIVPDAKAYEARLVISEGTLRSLSGSAANDGADESFAQQVRHSSTRTITAGVFMFLAVSFAGVWLVRSNERRNKKAIAAAITIGLVLGLATIIARANAGPPGYIRWQNLPQSLKDGKATSGDLNIDVVPGNDFPKLIIPMRKQNSNGEE